MDITKNQHIFGMVDSRLEEYLESGSLITAYLSRYLGIQRDPERMGGEGKRAHSGKIIRL